MATSPEITKKETELKDVQAQLNASMDKQGADANAETETLAKKLNALRTELDAMKKAS